MKSHFQISDLYYKSFTIVISDSNDLASTIKLNYDCKALASVINYNRKYDPQFDQHFILHNLQMGRIS